MRRQTLTFTAAVAALVLAASGCSAKANSEGGQSGGVKGGPGVTSDTISLGVLTDLTGPIAVLGKPILQGNQLYVDELNAAGGVCGRDVKLVIKDHGYDVQKAVSAYTAIEPQTLGMVTLHGSPITAALSDQITKDDVLTVPSSLASTLLSNPRLIIPGATYDVQMITALDHLTETKKLKAGDKVGHVYFEGEAGNNALVGARHAAEKLGLTLLPTEIKVTDVDLTAQVTALKSQDAKAVFVITGPRQVASAASVAKSIGYDVPILTSDPGWHPSVLDTPAASALEANVQVVSSTGPISADTEAAKRLIDAYKEKFPKDTPNPWINWGYVSAKIYGDVLEKACADKDLTRGGLAEAVRGLQAVDSGGLFPTLDFSKPGKPSSMQVYIGRPSKDAPGGLEIVKPFFSSDLAAGYEIPRS
ncbi:ABC transporter substrate-binding protein [Actinomadura sp. 3N407]|uniref:ABC transporter substrate-binding protein n=1 Tax=Actinomadura sp. 3N407 TaxID=3457423 RepID=UPI003FCE0338